MAYVCQSCGGIVTAWSPTQGGPASKWYPEAGAVDPSIPQPAGEYLKQAKESLHSPAGAAMLAASAVDAMLKAKGFKKGELFERINMARDAHAITPDMATWAHQVRLDANEPRHADEVKPLPTAEEAQRTVEFAEALGEILFVLPSRVTRGVEQSKPAGT